MFSTKSAKGVHFLQRGQQQPSVVVPWASHATITAKAAAKWSVSFNVGFL